jgi:hypothetical protein
MTSHSSRDGDKLRLERTGPFIPPISFPGISDVLVTDSIRGELDVAGLSGFSFREVVKHRIVRLDWHNWDKDAHEPVSYPAGGEPENYILGCKHSPEVALNWAKYGNSQCPRYQASKVLTEKSC